MTKKKAQGQPPPIAWLRVTDYMHGWIQHELGCTWRVREQHVVCVQHLEGAREALRMETVEDMLEPSPLGQALSDTRMNMLLAGLVLDAEVVRQMYGATREELAMFVPIECPKLRLTEGGVLRPWSLQATFSRQQAVALQRILREAFWMAVKEFDAEYAERQGTRQYPAAEMLEEFCERTKTPDVYLDAMRREWQRRQKRKVAPTLSYSSPQKSRS